MKEGDAVPIPCNNVESSTIGRSERTPLNSFTQVKGVCHEIFDLQFFHDSNSSGPLINRLKYFRIKFRFHRDIQSQI